MDKRLQRVREILKSEADSIIGIPIDERILFFVNILSNCKGKVVTSGMGKAGIIARKSAATLSSTGCPAIFIHPGEAQHGDLGAISSEDVIIAYSNSGQTREVLEFINLTKKLYPSIHICGIVSSTECPLSDLCDIVIETGVKHEADILDLAPTNSTTAMLALSDAISLVLMEQKGVNREDFHKRHHGGYIGQKLANDK